MSPFKEKVIEIIQMIPEGYVMSYSQVALYAGIPRAARQVGWILNGTEGTSIDLPWWRVVNNLGRISIKGTKYNDRDMQRNLLQTEGLEIAEDYTFLIETYRYIIPENNLKQLQLPDEYIERIIAKFGIT